MIPMMEHEIVKRTGWLTQEEFLDILAVAQATPGLFAVDMAGQTGQNRGRPPNAPTANVQLPPYHYALSGVFVVEADGAFGTRRGVASFGFNPTVSNNRSQKLEVHLFDFNGDLYGQRIFVRFLHKLRDEKKFESIEALKTQILQDMEDAKVWKP